MSVAISAAKSVALITASTRTPRVGPHVAAFIKELLEKDTLATPAGTPITLSEVDLASFKLPVYDEALVPARVQSSEEYAHEHTRAWSNEIRKHDAYVLVTPEYNYGVGGGVKNAIDYLMNEWQGKPVAIISYGIMGGAFASDQINHILSHMQLRVAETRPQLSFGEGGLGPQAISAMGGTLTDTLRATWTEKYKADVLKAFAEVRDLLDQEPPPIKKH